MKHHLGKPWKNSGVLLSRLSWPSLPLPSGAKNTTLKAAVFSALERFAKNRRFVLGRDGSEVFRFGDWRVIHVHDSWTWDVMQFRSILTIDFYIFGHRRVLYTVWISDMLIVAWNLLVNHACAASSFQQSESTDLKRTEMRRPPFNDGCQNNI